MRQVAKHVYIKEIIEGTYEEKEGWEPNILHTGRGTVSRVNLIGTVIEMGGQKALDDGTGQITLRAFDEVPGLKDARSGQVSLVIGRPRKYQDSLYLIPEVVRKVDPKWAQIRKHELGVPCEPSFVNISPKTDEPSEKPVFDNNAEHVIAIIAGLDEGDGAPMDQIIEESELGEQAESIVEQLLLDGEIFEIRPGVVKVL